LKAGTPDYIGNVKDMSIFEQWQAIPYSHSPACTDDSSLGDVPWLCPDKRACTVQQLWPYLATDGRKHAEYAMKEQS
jgi:hypothetical protein